MLGLQNISAVHRRIEELAIRPEFQNAFDVVVSRSFAALDVFSRDIIHFLSKSGRIIAYKKKEVEKEIIQLKKLPEMVDFSLDVKPYVLPRMELERVLVILKREGDKMGEQ